MQLFTALTVQLCTAKPCQWRRQISWSLQCNGIFVSMLLLVLSILILTKKYKYFILFHKNSLFQSFFFHQLAVIWRKLWWLSLQRHPSCKFKGEVLESSQSWPKCDPIKINVMQHMPMISVIENPVLKAWNKNSIA